MAKFEVSPVYTETTEKYSTSDPGHADVFNERMQILLDNDKYNNKQVEDLKKYVSDGKKGVAEAITEKGVETATDAEFQLLQDNIRKIVTLSEGSADATAAAKYIVKGYTAYVNGTKLTGTLPNRSHVSHGAEGVVGLNSEKLVNVAVSPYDGAKHWMTNTDGVTRLCLQAPYGVYGGAGNPGGLSGDGYVGIEVKVFGDAEASDVAEGVTFTSKNGLKIKGTMESFFVNRNEIKSTLPYASYILHPVVLNNEIHVLGFMSGSATEEQLRLHYKWNGTAWVSVSTLPYALLYGCAVVVDDEIHIMGCVTSAGNNNARAHYKWNGTAWESVSTLPFGFNSGSAVVLNDEIHIIGGGNGGQNATEHYKWNGTSWTNVSMLPYSFMNGSAVVLNDEIHIMGGSDTDNKTEHYKWNGTAWESVSTLPFGNYNFGAVVLDGCIYIIGGTDGSTTHNEILQYNGTVWASVGTIPQKAYGDGAVVLAEGIHFLGGRNLSTCYNTHYIVVEKNYRKVA